MNQNTIYTFISGYNKSCLTITSSYNKSQQNSRGASHDLYIFWVYNCVKFPTTFPPTVSSPEKAILNRMKASNFCSYKLFKIYSCSALFVSFIAFVYKLNFVQFQLRTLSLTMVSVTT